MNYYITRGVPRPVRCVPCVLYYLVPEVYSLCGDITLSDRRGELLNALLAQRLHAPNAQREMHSAKCTARNAQRQTSVKQTLH